MNELLKKYDKMLFWKKLLDWTIEIKRKSPFYKSTSYDVVSFKNQMIGSWRWIYDRIQRMDSQRIDFFTDVKKKDRKDDRMTRDIVSTMFEDKILI